MLKNPSSLAKDTNTRKKDHQWQCLRKGYLNISKYPANFLAYIIVLIVMFASCSTTTPIVSSRELKGHWVGKGDIIVTWCERDQLNFDLYIDSMGGVSGRVGDAKVVGGHLFTVSPLVNTGENKKYIIRATLAGFLVKEEQIARHSVSIRFELANDAMEGEMNTSGTKCGTRDSMYFKVANIILVRVDGK